MCTVLLPPGGYPIAVKKYIKYIISEYSFTLFSSIVVLTRNGQFLYRATVAFSE